MSETFTSEAPDPAGASRGVSFPAFERRRSADRRRQTTGRDDHYEAEYQARLEENEAQLLKEKELAAQALQQAIAQTERAFRSQLAALTASWITALAPSLVKRASLERIDEILATIAQENLPTLLIKASPDFAEILGRRLGKNVSVESDESLAGFAIDMNWRTGGARLEPDAWLEALKALIEEDIEKDESGTDDAKE